ncbi:site-specific DNA-methyltransferase [Leucothrix sargassi]|nr:site-specific DNA-methyltransferase [Leucothrix sargassi]
MSQDTYSTDTQMNGETLDVVEQRKLELKQLFPSAFTETLNEKGELVSSIDFERLKAELGEFSDVFESRREKYGMDWPGKRDALRLVQEPSQATLKPCREESIDFDNTENLFIEGDNLEVLKLLQKPYYSKVKMIYIDPPYNTGKEFIYPDKYSESLETYLSYAGLMDGDSRKFTTNTASEGRFHTKWLNMMYPRLYLARNLLKDDGVIFISIDDNEVENLRRMCDEVFGEENFIACVIWQRAFSPKNDAKYLSENHDYILIYSKNIDLFDAGRLERTQEANARYKNLDDDSRGVWISDNLTVKTYSEKYDYTITTPSGRDVNPSHGSCWRVSKEKFQQLASDNRIWFGKDGDNVPRLKRFLSEVQSGMVATTLWSYKDTGHNQEGRQEVKALFDDKGYFDGPKPIRLLKRVLKIANVDNGDIVLDFFAGSCSLAHAVMLFDEKKINYLTVQLPEPCDEKSEAYKSGYKTIADIGKERILRAANKVQKDNPEYNGDLGFKVLKLDQSNFKHWQAPERNTSEDDLVQQMELHIDHVGDEADPEAILYELLIKAGFMPTAKVETLNLAEKSVYSIAGGALLVYLENQIDSELIQAVADAEPAQFLCLDKAFGGNDQLKANAVQTFRALNQSREMKIEFRTV